MILIGMPGFDRQLGRSRPKAPPPLTFADCFAVHAAGTEQGS